MTVRIFVLVVVFISSIVLLAACGDATVGVSPAAIATTTIESPVSQCTFSEVKPGTVLTDMAPSGLQIVVRDVQVDPPMIRTNGNQLLSFSTSIKALSGMIEWGSQQKTGEWSSTTLAVTIPMKIVDDKLMVLDSTKCSATKRELFPNVPAAQLQIQHIFSIRN